MTSLFLSYAGPPLLGAFIGYLTNKVAIRMLFRPLRRWRVLGIPVPMTPGVIPSKRHDLARNIGEMVGTHLLTSRDIGSALSEERFQDHLRARVDGWVSELLAREFGPLPSLVPERFQTYLKVAVRTVKYQARMRIHRSIQGDEFAQKVSMAVLEQLRTLGDRPLNTLVSRDERQAVYAFIDTLVADLLAGERTGEWLAGHLYESLRNSAAQGKTVADYLPAPLQELVLTTIRQRSPEILHHLGRMLAEPPVRERIIRLARGAVENFIGTLGPLGTMARGFLNLDRLEGTLHEYLTGREGDIRTWLENQEVQQHFSTVLTEQAEKYLRTPVAQLLEGVAEEQLASVCREVALQVLNLLRTPGVLDSLAALLRDSFEEMLGQGERQIGDLSEQVLGRETVVGFGQTIAGETVALLRSQRAAKLIDKMVDSVFDGVLRRPVGVLNTILPAGVRAGLADYAVLTINRILLREVPSIVDSLNIRQIVTAKVDSLDLLRLERLLLSIMEEQFKYINLFGALLGFLLGLINLLVPRLT
jgi:uncharacterized membrane protein YheB (UPF0754 family)